MNGTNQVGVTGEPGFKLNKRVFRALEVARLDRGIDCPERLFRLGMKVAVRLGFNPDDGAVIADVRRIVSEV